MTHTLAFRLAPALLAVALSGCALTPVPEPAKAGSDLTHGAVQLTLRKGETTKTQVLEAFGAPNITTLDAESREVWTYQRHATVASSTASETFGTVILFGGSSRATGFEQSSRTMTLIIKFDKNNTVYDFRSRATSF